MCEVLLSFAMGHMTNAAVDRQVDALVRSSVQCVACLAALYVLYIGEIRLRKSLSGRCLCAVKADLYAALAARGAASFHRQTDSYYLNLLYGDMDLLAVAVREVREESGIPQVLPLSEDIFSLEILTVDGHEKKGAYVPSHLHLNVTYLLQADDGAALSVKPDENSGVAWFTPDKAVAASTEPWFQARIYSKLNRKLEARKAVRGAV